MKNEHFFHTYIFMTESHHASIPQTEEIRLKMITTANISNKFSYDSPYISNTFSRESPKFEGGFHVSKRSPRHSKETTDFCVSLEIQLF